MKDRIKVIKTCANCKHFKIIKKGMEFKNILDSSYLISSCKIKGWKTKEYYLQTTTNMVIKEEEECEFWEEWKPKKKFLFWR